MSLLEVQDIDVFYGSIQALRGVSLSVEAGERVALLGANGAGKTTTLRTVSGLLAPRRGSISFGGQEIGGLPAYTVVGKGIAHAPEGRALFPGLSVEENLRFGYLPRRKEKDGYPPQLERVMAYFPRLRERRGQAAGTLSGGEQQMLVIARALMSAPKLLIVDELSLGLAPKVVAQLFDIIREVNHQGTAVLIVEQFVHMALANTDRAYVLAKGEVVLEGTSRDLLGSEDLVESYLGGGGSGKGSSRPARAKPAERPAETPAERPSSSAEPDAPPGGAAPSRRTRKSLKAVAASRAALLSIAIVMLWIGSAAALLGRASERGVSPVPPAGAGVRGADISRVLAPAPDPAAPPEAPARRAGDATPGQIATSTGTGRLPLSIRIAPACGRAGDRLTATVTSARGSRIALQVVYPDGRTIYDFGRISARGGYSFVWLVDPAAERGEGLVFVTALHDATARAAEARAPFRIAGTGGCA